MDDAKFNSASSILLTFFEKWLFDLLNPPKSPQNDREKSETKIVKSLSFYTKSPQIWQINRW